MAPQFKKLTDCPEKLREAIDWLIQVKHGGDGSGLEKLAAALKRFIEEAIKDATNRLQTEYKKLVCPFQHTANETNCQHYQKQIEKRKKEIQDQNTGQDVNKDSEVKRLTAKISDCNNKYHNERYRDPSKQKSVTDIEDRQKKLKDLSEQLEKLIGKGTNSGECNALLTKLCTGLETFLGFNPSSKGYDGTGIVYSDLDRLCDAVMAFLHGLLSGVHEKQPYKAGKYMLKTKVIDKLGSKVCHGHEGFKHVISEVAQGLRGYNDAVRRSNNSVKSLVIKMQKDVGSKFKQSVKYLLPPRHENVPKKVQEAKKQVDEMAENCKQNAATFSSALDIQNNTDEIKDAINDINPTLRLKLDNVRRILKHESERLGQVRATEDKNLETTMKNIIVEFQKLSDSVNKELIAEVTEVFDTLKTFICEVMHQLNEINDKLKGCILKLSNWIEETDTVLQDTLRLVQNILVSVDEEDPTKFPRQIKATAELIQAQTNLLNTHFEELKSKLDREVGKVERARERLKDLKSKLHVNDDLGTFRRSDGDWQLEERIEEVISKIEKNIKSHVGTILNDIKITVETIKGSGSKNRGLDVVRKKVKEYAEKFQTFDTIKKNVIQGWVQDILQSKSVLMTLAHYVGMTGGKVTDVFIDGTNVADVAGKIIDALENDISASIGSSFIGDIGEEMHTNLTKIKNFLSQFAEQLDLTIAAKAGAIFDSIQVHIKHPQFTSHHDRATLIDAIELILHQLLGMARQVAKQIESLISDNIKIGNVDEAYQNGTVLIQKLDEAITQTRNDPSSLSGHTTDLAEKVADIATKVGSADKEFGKLLKATADKGITKLQEKIQQDVLDAILNDVDNKVEQLVNDAQNAYSAIFVHSTEVNSQLAGLCSAIKKEAGDQEGLKTKLENFAATNLRGTTLDNQLAKIKENLNTLQRDMVSGPIKLSTDLKSSAEEDEKETIRYLKAYIENQIQTVQSILTTYAQKQYVSTIQMLLVAFADKIQGELHGLPEEIDDDLKIGFKGFMVRLHRTTVPAKNGNNLGDAKNATKIKDLSLAFTSFFQPLKDYLNTEIERVNEEENGKKNPTLPRSQHAYASKLEASNNDLNRLLYQINGVDSYDRNLPKHLDYLMDSLNGIAVDSSGERTTPLLDCIGQGLTNLVQELRNAYISTYDGADWEADHSAKYAKVLVTISRMLFHDLFKLKRNIENPNNTWKGYKMYTSAQTSFSLCDIFFNNHGYDASSPANAQYGELNHKDDFKGESVLTHLTKDANGNHLFKSDGTPDGTLYKLFGYVETYYDLCNLLPRHNPKHPCNVFEMLIWISGLVHNPAYKKLKQHINEMIESEKDLKLRTLLDTAWSVNLPSVSTYCYPVLVGITGHGDSATYYGCQYLNNSFNLYYPPDGAQCFDMLLDVLRKLFPVFQFLNTQCKMNLKQHGWRDCVYGKDVGSSNWKCTDHSTTKPDCQSTSPLMSYLNDCLPGHLPHQLQSVGCMPKCSTCSPSSPNMPCLIPLGFRAFSGSTKTGKYLSSLLGKICGDNGVLTDLYSALTCLEGRPPKTFPDIFSFYYNLTRSWKLMRSSRSQVDPMQQAICDEITGTVACDYDVAKSFLQTCRFLYESSSHFMHEKHLGSDLSYLVGCGNEDCGYFIKPLDSVGYSVFASKHAYKYLSWLIYCASDLVRFFEQLKSTFCNISCADYGCSHCLNSEDCLNGKHGTAKCGCKSMVDCKGVLPTFYSYGMIFQDSSNRRRKSCSEFNDAINGIFKSGVLTRTLQAIDAFLFAIRTPFIWLTVALWSLSLFYLICVMVGRLDVLHIRSHLRAPASYKIAAQSLLAAARVGKLSKISYLQA